MKLAVIGDVHIADVAPSTRKDDYKETVLGKLKFIIDRVNADPAYKAILMVGDLFHKKIPFHNSHSMISALLALFGQSKCPIYIIPGNHDIHGNMSTFENQPMNVLIESGVLKMLDGSTPVELYSNDAGLETRVSLNGCPFRQTMESKSAVAEYELKHLENADFRISMFHQMILPDGKKFFLDYVNFSDLQDVHTDMIICGHYHEGFTPSVCKVGEMYFVNGGSITRGTAEQANFEKAPKFVTLEILKLPFEVRVKYADTLIPYLDAKDVFDFTVIERNKKKKDMHEFMDGLSEMENQALSTQEPTGIMNALKLLGMEKRLEPLIQHYLDEAYIALN